MTGDRSGDGGAFLPFPLQELVPAELRGVLCEFVWDSGKLRRLPPAMLPLILQEVT